MDRTELPFLDITRPGFSTKGREVVAAREATWCARTPYGLAVLRHREAGRILRDRRFRQGSHNWPARVGLGGPFARFWSESVIGQEGESHRRLRRAAMAALSEDYVTALRGRFRSLAETLVDAVRGAPSFDFVERISEPFAGRAVTTLLGLPEQEADWIARDASALGLAMGIDAAQHADRVNAACGRLFSLARDLLLRSAGDAFPARLKEEGQGLSPEELENLIVISIFGGVDTTRAQLAFAAALFIRHPGQWRWLRANRNALPNAIDEVIRTWPTTTWATREALEDVEISGVPIPAGETLHILVHATGTDPAAMAWGGFDVRDRGKVHFGFGGGAHHCLGQFVARTDMAEALGVMLDRWETIRWAGDPECGADSGNTHPLSWPVAPRWI